MIDVYFICWYASSEVWVKCVSCIFEGKTFLGKELLDRLNISPDALFIFSVWFNLSSIGFYFFLAIFFLNL